MNLAIEQLASGDEVASEAGQQKTNTNWNRQVAPAPIRICFYENLLDKRPVQR